MQNYIDTEMCNKKMIQAKYFMKYTSNQKVNKKILFTNFIKFIQKCENS